MLRSMSIQPVLAPRTTTADTPDPALQAGLAELFQLGLAVARVMSRLAEVEGRAIEALAVEAAETTRDAFIQPGSWADAVHAGHKMDTSEAAREAIAARMASITQSFDLAARAVRRTAALQARLAEGRRRFARQPGREQQGRIGGAARQPANDTERAERLDDPEWGNEIAGRSDEEVVRDICRDLAASCRGLGEGDTTLDAVMPAGIRALCAWAAWPAVPVEGPGMAQSGVDAGDRRGMLPEPDS
jgi:hypothetical protein